MIGPMVSFFNDRVLTAGMSQFVGPRNFIESGCFHNECILVGPFAYGVSIVSGIAGLSSGCAHVGWKLSAIRPDFAPHSHVLIQFEHSLWSLFERKPARLENRRPRKTQWIARDKRIVCFGDR